MGSAFADLRLADVSRADRLDELDFELPLGQVDGGAGSTTVASADIGAVLARRLPDDDPVRPWADRLAGGLIRVDLGGFLTGSIDLVLRVAGPDGPRFCVVDYKTNRLGRWGVDDSVANYHPDLLPAAMEHHHYPLQAVLYSVALHRYLRWRLPGYSPDRHLGPVGYLFVRGMVGPRTPSPGGRAHGVFAWSAPPDAVVELSDLLHGQRTRTAS
jgi:exodeoxyribonuclease V beta subunit